MVDVEDKEEESEAFGEGRLEALQWDGCFLGGYDKVRGDVMKGIEMCFAFFFF